MQILEFNHRVPLRIWAKQGDTNRVVAFRCIKDAIAIDLTGCIVTCNMSKPSVVFANASITNAVNGEISISLASMINTAGIYPADVSIVNASGKIISSATFELDIEATQRNDAAIEATEAYSALQAGYAAMGGRLDSLSETKANKSDLANGRNYKGKVTYVSTSSTGYTSGATVLPTTNNVIGDYYYVDENSHYYMWNGTAFDDIGIGDSGYTYLNSKLADIVNVIGGICTVKNLGLWAPGWLTHGVYSSSIYYRLSTKTPIHFVDATTLYIAAGRRIVIHTVSSNGTFISDSGWITGEYTIPAGAYVMIMISAATSTTSAELDIHADVDTFTGYVTYNFSGLVGDVGNIEERLSIVESIYPSYKYNMIRKAIFCGDSVTEGFAVEGTQSNPQVIYQVMADYAYPAQFKKIHPAVDVTVKATSGYTAIQWLNNYYATINFAEYDLAVIELGYNGYLNIDDYNADGTNTNAYKQIVAGIRSQNPDCTIVIVRSSHGEFNNGWVPVLDKLKQDYGCIIIDLTGTKYLNLDSVAYHGYYNNGGTAEIDWAHFTRKGYNAKAYVVSRLIADQLI